MSYTFLERLKAAHHRICQQIDGENRLTQPDSLRLSKLKKIKLSLKDRMAAWRASRRARRHKLGQKLAAPPLAFVPQRPIVISMVGASTSSRADPNYRCHDRHDRYRCKPPKRLFGPAQSEGNAVEFDNGKDE
ncbi:MAG: DUF465 domain-containing protein [Sphingomonadaceae bacterium]